MTRLKPGKLSKRAQILIPELLNLILVHLDRSDYTRLVSVSQLWFHCIVPLLWQNITGLTRLFSLIPNTKVTIKKKLGNDTSERIVIIHISRRANFGRFEFYAKFVKALDVRDIYKLQGEKGLSAYCGSRNHPLLPNLASLTCRYTYSSNPLIMLDWIAWFFGTSLLKLSAVQDAPSFWVPAANTKDEFVLSLLELVAPKCPNLQQVELPSYSSILLEKSGAKVSKISLVPQLSHLLPALRVVSGNASLLAPQSLEALGQLPCLETLKINAQYGERSSIATGEIQWSELYFPTMQHLHLVAVRFETLQSLWNFEALVHTLTTLEIETRSQGRSTASCIASRASLIDFMRELPSRSPYIIDLDCRLHACRFFCSTCVPARLSFPELDSLNALPLQRLSLQRIWLAENMSHSHLADSVPHVRTLQLRDMTLTLKDLYHYVTRLPRLEHFRCALSDPCLERKSSLIEGLPTEWTSTAHQVITFNLKLPHLAPPEHPLHEDQIIFLARYLYRLCPRARCSSIESEFELVCRKINKLLLKFQ
ncbi:hypothetical protein ACGC1H_003745 [Rhizoctonia solani]